jgi:dTDP-glucose 4,6-dehydratase
MAKRILLTGGAGFIGFNLSMLLTSQGYEVVGIDSANDDGDLEIKKQRLKRLRDNSNYSSHEGSISDERFLDKVFSDGHYDAVIHLAALAGVRISTDEPLLFGATNIMGTLNLLNLCQKYGVGNFLFASSSSVYGAATGHMSEEHDASHPLSIYAASKSSGEQLCYAYHHLHQMNIGVMRFFTAYGPWGRPNMLILSLIKRTDMGEQMRIFGKGDAIRTYIYIDDLTDAIRRLLEQNQGYQVFNFAGTEQVTVNEVVQHVEQSLGKKAQILNVAADPSDAPDSSGATTHAEKVLGWKPRHSMQQGIEKTTSWYLEHREWLRDAVASS